MPLSQNRDSYNILLINRTLILIDLMKNLDDKYFLEKHSYMLCHIVNNIIIQVSYFYFVDFLLKFSKNFYIKIKIFEN